MRLNCCLRICRFIFYLLTILCGVLIFNYRNDRDAHDYCENRNKCFTSNLIDIYPNLYDRSANPIVTINFRHNVYNDFYYYKEKQTYGFNECYEISKEV